ncbi:biotin--[acetyl-CoA-carboxylase] ligase, partial [Mycobacterium avium subsp. hominissuis]|nr:biotin--[acetyl-CoA-carboxylase] ligase [Mycobacterium avium subsp. hominissuis]
MTDRDRLRAPLDAAALRAELIGTGLGWRRL